MSGLPHLLSPLILRGRQLRNRIVSTAHATCLATHDGLVGEEFVQYHAARARGGVGLIITESMSVHPTSKQLHRVVSLWDERVIPGLRRLTDAVHAHGAVILCQLHHGGRQQDYDHVQWPPVSASDVPCPLHRQNPAALSPPGIDAMVEAFAAAAATAVAGGYDGVEIHCAHGYLIQQFLSPLTNCRTDEYGGSLENRLRFAHRVIRAVRERVGPNVVVGVRAPGDEFVAGGLTHADCQEIAVHLQVEDIDYLSISYGLHFTPQHAIPSMSYPQGTFVRHSAAFKPQARVPLLISHRIKSVQMAEEILASGQADLVAMTRAMIAEPELAKKAAAGDADAIRPCIGCIQGCIGRVRRGWSIACLVNPEAGQESQGRPVPVTSARKVAVVGGGPGGLQAALTLQQEGHTVTLFERADRVGGQVRLASSLPRRGEFFAIIEWMERQFVQAGGDLRLSTAFTPAHVCRDEFQAVVLATGAEYAPPGLGVPAGDAAVCNLPEGMDLALPPGSRVAVVDRQYRNQALLLALHLQAHGMEPVVLSQGQAVAADLDAANRHDLLSRTQEAGIRVASGCTLHGVTGRTLGFTHEGWPAEVSELAAVVVVEWPRARTELQEQLRALHPGVPVYTVGDALAPGTAEAAIRTAHQTALSVR